MCGNKLFDSESKFDKKCGWPAFSKCEKGSIKEVIDHSYGMKRVEVRCSKVSIKFFTYIYFYY